MGFRYDIAFEAVAGDRAGRCNKAVFRPSNMIVIRPTVMRNNAFLVIVAAVLVGGCTNPVDLIKPYRMEIQQGNFITQEMVSQLKPGQTREQVRFILGSPLVTDIFHADRWDYVFARQRANSREVEQRRIVVFFVDGKLARIEGDVVNPAAAGGAQAGAPAVK